MNRLLKAIVVEDDDNLRDLFAATLNRDKGIVAVGAHDLEECVRLCQLERQVVLIIDLGLPGTTGVDAVSVARERAPGATLVVVTGSEGLREAAIRHGAHEFIVKGSPESVGDGFINAVRRAVIVHSAKLTAAPAFAALDKMDRTLQRAEDRQSLAGVKPV